VFLTCICVYGIDSDDNEDDDDDDDDNFHLAPFTCVPGEECTNAIERDGYSWRLCEGSATGGCHPSQGRMEISLDGGSTWLGVCRSRWDREANLPVACRMLGFR